MTAEARFRQADIGRALREARKVGAKSVVITAVDGTSIDIVLDRTEPGRPAPGPLDKIVFAASPRKKIVP